MKIYLALDAEGNKIGYYANGQTYTTWSDVPIKRGWLSNDQLDLIADMVYQNGQLIDLATKHDQELRKARIRAQLDDIAHNDAFMKSLRGG